MAMRNQCEIEEVVETHQEEGFPQDSANGIHAMGDFKSVMNQLLQKQAHEMEAVCSKFQEEKNGTIMRLRAEVKNLRRCLRQCETSLSSLRKEKQEQTAEIDELKVVQANLKAEEGRLNTVVCKMRKANKELNDELQEKLHSERRTCEEQMDKLKAELMACHVQTRGLKQRLQKGLEQGEAVRREKQTLNDTLKEERKKNEHLEREVYEMEIELESERRNYFVLTEEKRERDILVAEQSEHLLANKNYIEELNERLKTELEQGEAVRTEKQTLNDTLKEERKKNEELKVKVQEHTASISDLMRERNLLQDQIRKLKETVQKETQKTAGLEEDLVQVLQQFQGVGRHALGVHAQLMQDLIPRAPDVVRAVSAEGNTVGDDTLQVVSGAWTETFQSASLPSMSLPAALQVPVENLPDVSTELLMTYLGRISVKWYEFAHALGVGDVAANLQQMEQSPVRKCLHCLEAWIERGPEADCSWEKLLRVLNVLKLHAVAKDILHELRRRASSNTL